MPFMGDITQYVRTSPAVTPSRICARSTARDYYQHGNV